MKASLFASAALLAASLASASPIKRWNYEIDDQSGQIGYFGDWSTLTNQGSIDYDGTESYTNRPGAYAEIGAPETGNFNLQVWAGKKADRGVFMAFVNGNWIGYGDEFQADAIQQTETQVVFERDSLNLNQGDIIRFQNANGQYFDLDMVKFTRN